MMKETASAENERGKYLSDDAQEHSGICSTFCQRNTSLCEADISEQIRVAFTLKKKGLFHF